MANVSTLLKKGRKLLYSTTCTVKRSGGSVSGYTTPAQEHYKLACSHFYEMSNDEAERAGLATISRPIKTYVELPARGIIQEDDILTANSKDYTVMKASLWPHQNPSHYELILEYKRP